MNPLRKLRLLLMDTLGFSKTEANGMIVLLMLVLLLAVVPRLLPSKASVVLVSSDAALTDWSKTLKAAISQQDTQAKKKSSASEQPMSGTFDPNTTTLEQMVAVGVPELLAKRMTLYREKGGRFRKPEDISKIYGMTPELTNRLLPHVRIANETSPAYSQIYSYPPEKIHTFELNTVAAEELQLIRGIGPYLSTSIVKYRDRLGGFHSYDQLKEIKGLKEEIIAEIQNRSSLVVNITPLDINSDSLKVLLRHPYLDYNMARIIINYRKVHGNFERPEDLRSIKVMSDSLYQKLVPYLPR